MSHDTPHPRPVHSPPRPLNTHGGRRPGAGAPRDNTNALRSGRYSRRYARAELLLRILALASPDEMARLRRRMRRAGDAASAPQAPTSPRNTSTARFSRTMSSSLNRPRRSPSRLRRTVVILSAIRREAASSPFTSSGSTSTRNSGASVGSVVNAQTVTESVASNRSSCMITTGRGFPAYPVPAAAVQISPRLNRHPG